MSENFLLLKADIQRCKIWSL